VGDSELQLERINVYYNESSCKCGVGRGAGEGHRNLGVNGFVKLYYVSGHTPHMPSAPQLIPAHLTIHRKDHLLSYKLETGCYVPRQSEMTQGAVLRVWRWRVVYYLSLC